MVLDSVRPAVDIAVHSIHMPRTLLHALFAAILLVSCSQPEPVFTDADSVRNAQANVNMARFTATMDVFTEATGDRWNRTVEVDWLGEQAVGDSTLLAWNLSDTYRDEEDTTRTWYRLWNGVQTRIAKDSILTADTVSGRSSSGNWIPNYYASQCLPAMLTDTAWWSDQSGDSMIVMTAEHLPPDGDSPERFIVTLEEVQDTTAEDHHPDTYSRETWTFRAPDGLPVQYRDDWFRGDMAYGRETTIAWNWEAVNDSAVATALAGWSRPDWTRDPAPKPEVAGGGDGDWYEETMAALPQVGSGAPALFGALLDGTEAALADYEGQVVYLDFWYIGCGPCMRAMPHLADMQEEFGPEGFTVLGVNHHQDAATVQRYLDYRKLDIPQLMIDSLPEGYPVRAYPTWFVIGRDGQVAHRDMGYGEGTDAVLDSVVRANLAFSAP